tara:strand:- start:32925 stop:33512 length:588 start_codon:yes stop_codon:yes gene_type:complete
MTQVQIHRAIDYVSLPWKKGTGSTKEIARDQGEGLANFGWRLSLADVIESGDFSTFNSYQRIITVLEGDGMQLEIDGQQSHPIKQLNPFAFSGDSQVNCQLLGSTLRNVNLIYSSQRYQARLQWLPLQQTQRLFTAANVVLLFNAASTMSLRLAEQLFTLQNYDCLEYQGNGELLALELVANTDKPCCLIELFVR